MRGFAEQAAEAIRCNLNVADNALADYDRRLRSPFFYKDAVSRIMMAFLAQPRLMDSEQRRLAITRGHRSTLTLVLTDQIRRGARDPRFLSRMLMP